jgi:TP901 family phage tail tape measure protein
VAGKDLLIGLIIKATDIASGPITHVATSLGKLREQAAGLQAAGAAMAGFGAASLAASAGITAALAGPLAAFAQLEEARTRAEVAFLTAGGQNDPLFAKIADQAEDLGNKLPGTTADFMQLAGALKSAGLSSDAIAGGALTAAANLKVLLGGSLSYDALGQMVAGFGNGLGIAEADFTKFADLVQRTKFAFGVDPTAFSYAVKYVGAAAQNLGLKGLEGAQELAPLIGMLQKVGISGETAGTSLRSILAAATEWRTKLAKNDDIKSLMPDLRKAGIDTNSFQLFDKGGQFLGLDNLYIQMEKLQGLSEEARGRFLKAMFGEEASNVASILSKQGLAGINKSKQAILDQADTQARLARISETLGQQWESLVGTATNLAAAIGSTLAPNAVLVTKWLNTAAETAGKWVKENQALVGGLMTGAALIAGFLGVLGTVSIVMGTATMALGWLRTGFAVAAIAARALGLALTLNPIGVAVMGIAAAAALIITYWEPIKGFFDGLWSGFLTGYAEIQPALAGLAAAWAPIGAAIEPLIGWIGGAFTMLADSFRAVGAMLGLVGSQSSEAGGYVSAFGVTIGQSLAGAIGWMAEMVTAAIGVATAIWNLPTTALAAIGQMIGYLQSIDLFAVGQALISRLWQGLQGMWAQLMGWFQGRVQALIGWLPDVLRRQMGLDGPTSSLAADTTVIPSVAALNAPAGLPQPSQLVGSGGGSPVDMALSITVNATGSPGSPVDGVSIAAETRDAIARMMPDILRELRREQENNARLAFGSGR